MPTCEDKIYSEDYYDILTDFTISESPNPNTADYCYLIIDDILGVIYVNQNDLPPLSLSRYTYRFIPKLYAPMLDSNVSLPLLKSGILPVQSPPLSLTGQNVVIGIADSGIDYTNPAFQNADGTTRILAIWDQTIPFLPVDNDISSPGNNGAVQSLSGNTTNVFTRSRNWNNDSIFDRTSKDVPFGTVYSRDEINRALADDNPYNIVPSRDETGHGTAMAAAAGGYIHSSDSVYGGAINAEFVIVKCKQSKGYLRNLYQINNTAIAYSETDLMLGCRFIDSFVRIFSRPIVFCLGIGSNMGAHNGSSFFSEYLDSLAVKRSRAVLVAGGNEGNSMGHYSNVGDSDVEIRVGENERGFTLEIWGDIPNAFTIQIVSPGGESTGVISTQIMQTQTYRFVYENTTISISAELTEQSSGLQVMTAIFQLPTPGIWTIRIRDAGSFHMWLPVRSFLSGETYFLSSNPENTITEPGYASEVITVSGYQDSNNAIWSESGRGDNVKPDFAAPSVDIPISSGRFSETDYSDRLFETEFSDRLFEATATGTSLSAAISAGAVAQFLEWAIIQNRDPYIKGREIKTYFQRGAVRDIGITYPNSQWGYGRMNLQGVFESLVGRNLL